MEPPLVIFVFFFKEITGRQAVCSFPVCDVRVVGYGLCYLIEHDSRKIQIRTHAHTKCDDHGLKVEGEGESVSCPAS